MITRYEDSKYSYLRLAACCMLRAACCVLRAIFCLLNDYFRLLAFTTYYLLLTTHPPSSAHHETHLTDALDAIGGKLVKLHIPNATLVQLDTCGSDADTRLALYDHCPMLPATRELAADGDGGSVQACGGGSASAQLKRGFDGVVRSSLYGGDYWAVVRPDGEQSALPMGVGRHSWQLRLSCKAGGWPPPIRTSDRCNVWSWPSKSNGTVRSDATLIETNGAATVSDVTPAIPTTDSSHTADMRLRTTTGALASSSGTLAASCAMCVTQDDCGWCASDASCRVGLPEGALLSRCDQWDPYGDSCSYVSKTKPVGTGRPVGTPARHTPYKTWASLTMILVGGAIAVQAVAILRRTRPQVGARMDMQGSVSIQLL